MVKAQNFLTAPRINGTDTDTWKLERSVTIMNAVNVMPEFVYDCP